MTWRASLKQAHESGVAISVAHWAVTSGLDEATIIEWLDEFNTEPILKARPEDDPE